MKPLVALLVAVLTLGVAHAAGGTGAVSPSQRVTSKDGRVTVAVPRGAQKQSVTVRVRVLSRAQHPPELRKAALGPGAKLYALEPAGTTFLKPVTVTNRIDAKAQGFDLAAVPGLVLTTRSANGRWEILKGQALQPSGTTLVVSGTTRHFSTLVAFDTGARVSLVPGFVQGQVGSTWPASVSLQSDRERGRVVLTSVQWAADGDVVRAQQRADRSAVLSCARVGTGRFSAVATVSGDALSVGVGPLAGQSYAQRFHLNGSAECKAAPARR